MQTEPLGLLYFLGQHMFTHLKKAGPVHKEGTSHAAQNHSACSAYKETPAAVADHAVCDGPGRAQPRHAAVACRAPGCGLVVAAAGGAARVGRQRRGALD
eukprot:1156840-Pelagomonas_calceolata.AAC.5